MADVTGNHDGPFFGVIPGLLGVSSVGPPYHGYVYGSQGCEDKFTESTFPIQVHLRRESGKLFDPSRLEPGFSRHGRYSINGDLREVRYARRLPFGYSAQYVFNLEEHGLSLTYNSMYRRYSDFVATLHPFPESLATIYTYYLFLEHDYLSLHCAAVEHPDKGTVAIFALPNTGKTQTAYKLATEHGATLLSDDIAVYGGQQLFGCPFTRSGVYFLTKKGGPPPFWSSRASIDRLFDYMEPDTVRVSGPTAAPRMIFVLRPGDTTNIRRLSSDEAFDLIYRLNAVEFDKIAKPELSSVASYLEWPNLGKLDSNKHRLTQELVDNCRDDIYEITAPDSSDFAGLTLSV